ncbi:MAG: RNA chaperone Hfq [Oscillospiraceae bacterium]|nr:RNA chaperone Hfq [Oscillospiraceae bacterium]
MHMSTALQDDLLDEIVSGKIPVTVFLMNGFQIKGLILDHDDAIVVLEVDGRQQIVYKHAISTIIPTRLLKSINK